MARYTTPVARQRRNVPIEQTIHEYIIECIRYISMYASGIDILKWNRFGNNLQGFAEWSWLIRASIVYL